MGTWKTPMRDTLASRSLSQDLSPESHQARTVRKILPDRRFRAGLVAALTVVLVGGNGLAEEPRSSGRPPDRLSGLPVTVSAEVRQVEHRGGPDGFGYIFRDSEDPEGPTFQWIDLENDPEATVYQNWAARLPLGFTFRFYDGIYDQLGFGPWGVVSYTVDPVLPTETFCGGFSATAAGTSRSFQDGDILILNRQFQNWLSDPALLYGRAFPSGLCPLGGYAGACYAMEYTNCQFYPPGEPAHTAGPFEVIFREDGAIITQYLDDPAESLGPVSLGILSPRADENDQYLLYACADPDAFHAGLAIKYWVPPVIAEALDRNQQVCAGSAQTFWLHVKASRGHPVTIGSEALRFSWDVTVPPSEVVPDGEWVWLPVTIRAPAGAPEGTTDAGEIHFFDQDDPWTGWSVPLQGTVTAHPAALAHNAPHVSMDNAVLENQGRLYVFTGRWGTGAMESYDIASDSWELLTPDPEWDIYPSDGMIGRNADGETVLLFLSDYPGSGLMVHEYSIDRDAWSFRPWPAELPDQGIAGVSMICDRSVNTCYISGGREVYSDGFLDSFFSYDVATGAVTVLPPMAQPRLGHFSFLWEGLVCVAGGAVDPWGTGTATTQCYDPVAQQWHAEGADLGTLPQSWWGGADGTIWDGQGWRPIIANGVQGSAPTGQVAMWTGDSWQILGSLVYPTYRQEGAAVGNRLFVMQGSVNASDAKPYTQTLELCGTGTTDLSIEKTLVGQQGQEIGTELTWQIEARNNGPERAHQAVVTDPLPENLDYVSDSCGGSWDASSHTWSWNLGDLPAGSRLACELVTSVIALDRGTITNHALIASDGDDPNPGNEDSEATAQVKQPGIPATTPVGVGLFVTLCALVGVLVLRRLSS